MELLLIRHSATKGNLLGQFVGSQDHPLAPEGEALALSRRERLPPVDKLWVSPMVRCRQTAELLYPGQPQHRVDDLRECNFGNFEGKTWEELGGDPVFLAWKAGDPNVIFPGGEALGEHIMRCRRGIALVVTQARQEGIARAGVLAHGGTLMSAMSGFAVPHRDFYSWLPKNCGGYRTKVEGDPFFLTLLEEL